MIFGRRLGRRFGRRRGAKKLTHQGLNMRRDLTPPIPFVIQYSDQAGNFYSRYGKKNFFADIRAKIFLWVLKYNLLTAFKRRKKCERLPCPCKAMNSFMH